MSYKNSGYIMNFSNNDIVFVTHAKFACQLKKYDTVISNINLKMIPHPMKCVKIKCIETLPM